MQVQLRSLLVPRGILDLRQPFRVARWSRGAGLPPHGMLSMGKRWPLSQKSEATGLYRSRSSKTLSQKLGSSQVTERDLGELLWTPPGPTWLQPEMTEWPSLRIMS